MPLNVIRGAGINLQNYTPLSLAACEGYIIPAGTWNISVGQYTFVEFLVQPTGIWLPMMGGRYPGVVQIESDGVNYRLFNRTGGQIGATVTTAGSGYTSAPSVTASAGNSKWQAVVGGLVNTTVTITAGGSGYLFPPILLVSSPPAGGVQARAHCTISGGAINAVTVDNQGAGYTAAPSITVVNDPRDTAGSGGILTAALTGSGTIAAVLCTDPGTAVTSVPTLTFTGGGGSSGAATALGVYTVTSVGAATGLGLIAPGALPTATHTNPDVENNIFVPRLGFTQQNAAANILDGGLSPTAPGGWAVLATVAALGSVVFGGTTDVSWLSQS